SEQERSEAWIDLEHDCIYAAFHGEDMVCAGSIELWEDDVADVGVICLPTYRRRGLAQMVITALNQWCLENGYLPMYRCLKDNVPSAKLAERIGFRRFATWDVALEASCPAAQPPGHDAILLVSGSDGSKTTDSSE